MSIKRFMHIFYLLGVKMASKIHTRSRGKILEEFKLVWKFLGMMRSGVWKMAPICLFWCIWGERNRRMFQEEEKSDTSLKNLFLRALLEWSQQFMDVDYLSFMNMLGGWFCWSSLAFLGFCFSFVALGKAFFVYCRCT